MTLDQLCCWALAVWRSPFELKILSLASIGERLSQPLCHFTTCFLLVSHKSSCFLIKSFIFKSFHNKKFLRILSLDLYTLLNSSFCSLSTWEFRRESVNWLEKIMVFSCFCLQMDYHFPSAYLQWWLSFNFLHNSLVLVKQIGKWPSKSQKSDMTLKCFYSIFRLPKMQIDSPIF